MRRMLILVEGPTEQAFVSRLLTPYLYSSAGILVSAPCIETSRDKARGRSFRGGHAGRYDLIRRHVRLLLSSDPAAYVSSMFDFYGLPDDFPGIAESVGGDCFHRACRLEQHFADDIGDLRFLPNLIIHEFEGLLFSSPEAIAEALMRSELIDSLRVINEKFQSPEEINDSPETAVAFQSPSQAGCIKRGTSGVPESRSGGDP